MLDKLDAFAENHRDLWVLLVFAYMVVSHLLLSIWIITSLRWHRQSIDSFFDAAFSKTEHMLKQLLDSLEGNTANEEANDEQK